MKSVAAKAFKGVLAPIKEPKARREAYKKILNVKVKIK